MFYKYLLLSIPSSDNIHWISSWLDHQEQCNSIAKHVRYILFVHHHTQKQSILHSKNFSHSFSTLLGISRFKWTKIFLFQCIICISSQRFFSKVCKTGCATQNFQQPKRGFSTYRFFFFNKNKFRIHFPWYLRSPSLLY